MNVNHLPESLDLIIHSQNITENLICGNVLTQTKNNRINIPVVNISVGNIQIKTLTINKLSYEEYKEEKSCLVSTTEPQREVSENRLPLLRKLI